MYVNPYTTEASLEIYTFLSYTYRVRFPIDLVLALHIHSSL